MSEEVKEFRIHTLVKALLLVIHRPFAIKCTKAWSV